MFLDKCYLAEKVQLDSKKIARSWLYKLPLPFALKKSHHAQKAQQ